MGGGTALAARWHHRHSVDVDLFVEPDPYRNFHWNTGGRFTLDLTAAAPVDRLTITDEGTYINFTGRKGHVSIDAARALALDPRSSDTVAGTDLPLETTAEILAKKLRFRMARDKELLPRDLCDIASARQKDPAALQTALDAVHTDQLGELVEVFKDYRIPDDLDQDTAVLSPSDPELAKRSPGIVERIVTRELDQRPPERGLRPELTR